MNSDTIKQHTPAPWHVSADGNDVENVNGAGVCSLYADETADANGRLIAAAPAMLARLWTVLRYVEALEAEKGKHAGSAAALANLIRESISEASPVT